MPYTPIGQLSSNASFEELRNYIIRLERKVDFLQQNLDTENIFEVGGWRVTPDQMSSKDKDVGMSTADTGADDVRYWAGSTDPETAPFNIRKSGKGRMTGIKIQSTESDYPRYEIDPDAGTVAVYFDEDKYIVMKPNTSEDVPVIEFINGANGTDLMMDTTVYSIQTSGDIIIANTGDITLTSLGRVFFDSWDSIVNVSASGLPSLQTDLNGKAKIASYNGGIPVGTVLAVDGGGTVTWGGINLT